MAAIRLFLASASPRRLELLRSIGLDPLPCPTGVAEDTTTGELPLEKVLRIAEAKARHAALALRQDEEDGLVLAADTVVVIDDAVLGVTVDSRNRLVSQQPSGNLRIAGELDEAASVTVNGKVASIDASHRFTATTPIGSGANVFTIVATDPAGNVDSTPATYPWTVT